MQAQLNITDYVVDELTVRSNPDYQRSSDKEAKGEIKIGFNVKRKDKEPLFMITMIIEVNKSKPAFTNSPYYVYLNIRGFYEFGKGTDEDTMQEMIGLNGLVMLYGVARGIVAQASANGVHGKFVLPSVNFVELIKNNMAAKDKPIKKRVRTSVK
jgi:preprotein translocase subunit SecB